MICSNHKLFSVDEKEFVNFVTNKIKDYLTENAEKDKINIALSGGSTPIPIYKELSKLNIDWSKINFFLVDERCVSISHRDSNYKNINEVLFQHVKANSFQMYFEEKGGTCSAEIYNSFVEKHVQPNINQIPEFDLMILGMGEDGHTASLFPFSEALMEEDKWVVENIMETKTRLTLTYKIILNAKKCFVLLKGKKKENVFNMLNLKADKSFEQYPILKVMKEGKNVEWIKTYTR
ncbi:MAG: 6-phosphogluconolactonase [Flavobacteriaceae bacterium]|nr:6-phosphogluconolactonase [Flavobacteriaceae bacterium]